MTHLEQLIKAHVEQTTVQTVSTATARIAEEMATLARNSRQPRARKTAKRRRP